MVNSIPNKAVVRSAPPVQEARERASVGFDLAFLFSAVVGVALVLLRQAILPARFSYDGDHIQQIAAGTASSFGDSNFGNAAEAYKALGLAHHPLVASLLGYAAFLWIVLLARRRIRVPRPQVAVLVVLVVILGAVYVGYYSKDVLVLPVVALVFILTGNAPWRQVVVVVAMVVYALLFRSYWILLAALYVGFQLFRLSRRSVGVIALSLIMSSFAIGAAVYVFLGVPADYYRLSANAGRDLSFDAKSAIYPFISVGEPISGLINSAITSVTLVLPVPLALRLSPYYLLVTAAIVFMWFCFFGGAREHRASGETDVVLSSSIVLLAAFVVVQGLFEPDYGSALRHLTPLLPLLLVVASPQAREKEPFALSL